jgi:hypothetical protein
VCVGYAAVCARPCSIVRRGVGDAALLPCDFATDSFRWRWFQVNTNRTVNKNIGMRHTEGGWPENVDGAEADQVDRYMKKAAKVRQLVVR